MEALYRAELQAQGDLGSWFRGGIGGTPRYQRHPPEPRVLERPFGAPATNRAGGSAKGLATLADAMNDDPSAVAGTTPRYRYDARRANELESRWQDFWEEHRTFWTPNPSGPLTEGFERVADRPKLYVLDMFPYPSGAGLHVGHP